MIKIKRKIVLMGLTLALTVVMLGQGSAMGMELRFSELPEIPQNLEPSIKKIMNERLNNLRKELSSLTSDANNFNNKTAQPVPAGKVKFYQNWQSRLERRTKSYNDSVALLKRDLESHQKSPGTEPESKKTAHGIINSSFASP